MGFTIAEDHADGASVGTVTATDADGDTLTYSLTSTDTAPFPLNVALFTINSATGEISVASGVQLDFEAQQTHLVEVGVSDGNDADGNPETTPTVDATIWVTIRVIDTEDDELRTARQATLPSACGADFDDHCGLVPVGGCLGDADLVHLCRLDSCTERAHGIRSLRSPRRRPMPTQRSSTVPTLRT